MLTAAVGQHPVDRVEGRVAQARPGIDRHQPAPVPAPQDVPPAFRRGAVTDWSISETFDATERDPAVLPDLSSLRWEEVAAENPGMLVINRYRRSPNILPPDREERIRGRRTGGKFVLARTTIRAVRDEVRKLKLGYSDEVVVMVTVRRFPTSDFVGL